MFSEIIELLKKPSSKINEKAILNILNDNKKTIRLDDDKKNLIVQAIDHGYLRLLRKLMSMDTQHKYLAFALDTAIRTQKPKNETTFSAFSMFYEKGLGFGRYGCRHTEEQIENAFRNCPVGTRTALHI